MIEEIELELEREVVTQTEVITCRLTTYEGMRRLSRQQFRQILRDKLQAFGDEILATWEKLYGPTEAP
jgi:pyrroline-5-carboxylate reductase